MTDQAPIDRVYEYGEGYRRCRTEVLSENKPKYICVVYSQWLLKYNVSREAESTTVNVSVDFVGRYIFSDQATLEVTVEAASNKVTETFDLEKTKNKLFSVNLTSDFSEAKNEDLQVSCTLCSTRIQYSTKTIGTVALFTAASRPHDVVLVVGEKKFYVHKLYLATWSKYFDALFYGDFAEKDKQEVKLEDVDSTEFETLLHIIHPSVTMFLDDDNVLYLLKLADRFDMPSVMAMCGGHLMDFEKCKSLSIMERLELSDKYNLAHLQVTCLEKIHQKRPAEFTVFLEENRSEAIEVIESSGFFPTDKMTGTHIGRVYEYVQPYHRSRREVLSENEPKNIWVDRYRWLLKYTVAREAESTTVQVYVDFTSRYRFSDQATLEVKVKTMDKAISKKINIEKRMNQLFSVDLTETGFSEVKNEDLKVICKISLTKIQYTNEKIGTSAHFSADSRPHDVVLLVGEKKFYVHKVYLATWSKYFDTLFYGNFAEKDKKEVKLEDVDSTEFEKLLSIIHPCIKISLTDKNVPYLLKLADRFDMPSVMAMCGNYLINFENCKWLSIMERLELSDKYNLTHLQEACLKSIHRKDPAEFTSFLEENREKIRTLSSNTVHNLI